ncbi:MAG: DUF2752 domain-containing protein [Bacteroidetes bacterium]|nr:DUF2752 domain-containing protein [Bacteroidota bacterium]
MSKAWHFLRHNLEAFVWIIALFSLAMTDPGCDHFSLCPLKNLGFEYCPGCGLGHSISWFFRGELLRSFEAHPLGVPAIVILLYRIVNIFYKYRKDLITQKSLT